MRIIGIEINWELEAGRIGMDPHFRLWTNRAEGKDLRWKAYPSPDPEDSHVMYVAEEAFLVHWLCHNPENTRGFGGSKHVLQMVDGTEKTIRGPWASRAAVVMRYTGIDVLGLDRINGFSSVCVGIRVEAIKEALPRFGLGHINVEKVFDECDWAPELSETLWRITNPKPIQGSQDGNAATA